MCGGPLWNPVPLNSRVVEYRAVFIKSQNHRKFWVGNIHTNDEYTK